jgi:hypothetical protein
MEHGVGVGLEELPEDVVPGREWGCLANAEESRNRWVPEQAAERTGIINSLHRG